MTATGAFETLALERTRLRGISPIDGYRHTMSPARLLRYLEIKVHHLIQEHDWGRIRVVGGYDRTCVISTNEKNDKLFNWQRPTAEIKGDELVIKCFPGRDYVHHYALVIATYLSLLGRYRGQVSYELPSEALCEAAVADLNVDPSEDHLVILGWGLGHFVKDAPWTYDRGYAWQRAGVGGRSVLYLGYLHSIWGDVAYRVVARLALLGARRVVYVGKVGSLDPSIAPNSCLATGRNSSMGDTLISWPDFFGDLAASQPDVHSGVHVTSPSILLEDQDWLAEQPDHRFVDPEIGHMGRAAHLSGIEFGFLHVISNNLAFTYDDDLSNERLDTVIERRIQLLDRIAEIVQLRLRTTTC